jgi:hypothetical protein
MEIACKAGDNKVISAFPDVCLSPPSPPAGPLPVPYPLFSNSQDMTNGSKTVKISGKEVMLKDKSYYKKCTGDEAATKSLGQGAITHTLTGKVYFISWCMDVLIEGENVVRHLDMTTSNHASPMANGPTPIPGMDTMSPDVKKKCDATYKKYGLSRYGSRDCESGHASHHAAQNACFITNRKAGTQFHTVPQYNQLDAPGICLRNSHRNTPHWRVSQAQKEWAQGLTAPPTYKDLRAESKRQLKQEAKLSENEAECIMQAVDAYMKKINVNESTQLRPPGS